MKIRSISIKVSEDELLYIFRKFLGSRNIFIEDIKIDKGLSIKNICYGIIRNINLNIGVHKVLGNKIYLKINKISFRRFTIPKGIANIFLRFISVNFEKQNKKGRILIIINLDSYIKSTNVRFLLTKLYLEKGFINIIVENVDVESKSNKLKSYRGGRLFLKLTQTTLKLSGEDIMSFVKDFIRTDKVMISGIDVSQAVYIKGIIVNSFDVGDVSVNIKDMKENLLYIQLKIINSVFPGVNIEHIPVKIFVKDVLRSFNNLNLDLDIGNVRFVDDCIEVRINNLNFDMKKLSPNSGNIFLK